MKLTKKEIKQRYFDKKKKEAKLIKCACGCGEEVLDTDDYGRPRKFVSGHNARKYELGYLPRASYEGKRRKRTIELKVFLFKEHTTGACECCGVEYDGFNGSIFHFHHTNPEDKKFALSARWYRGEITPEILEEVKKCILLCANCHSIIHNGVY